MRASGGVLRSLNNWGRAAGEGSTHSVMRSCSKASIEERCAASSFAVPSKPPFSCKYTAVARSTRATGKPQLRAMSVALEPHGDSVPSRGATTTHSQPAGFCANGMPYCSSSAVLFKVAASCADDPNATACKLRVVRPTTLGAACCTSDSVRAQTKSAQAWPPSNKWMWVAAGTVWGSDKASPLRLQTTAGVNPEFYG